MKKVLILCTMCGICSLMAGTLEREQSCPVVPVTLLSAVRKRSLSSIRRSRTPRPLSGRRSVTPTLANILQNLSVLVVDDQAVNLKLAEGALKKKTSKFTTANGGPLGVRLASEKDFSFILMDVDMPGVNGLQATMLLRAAHVNTPIIALTASTDPEVRAKCMRAGMDGFLPKPLRIKAVATEVMRVLRARKLADSK